MVDSIISRRTDSSTYLLTSGYRSFIFHHRPLFLFLPPTSSTADSVPSSIDSSHSHSIDSPATTQPSKIIIKKIAAVIIPRINPLLCTGIIHSLLDGRSILLCHSSLCGEACLYFLFIGRIHSLCFPFVLWYPSRMRVSVSEMIDSLTRCRVASADAGGIRKCELPSLCPFSTNSDSR